MSTLDAAPPTNPQRGAALLISYDKLLTIETHLITVSSKLDACLMLKGAVDELDRRVRALERGDAFDAGTTKTWKTVLTLAGTAVSSAVAGGALSTFLPKIWGG